MKVCLDIFMHWTSLQFSEGLFSVVANIKKNMSSLIYLVDLKFLLCFSLTPTPAK